MSNSYILGIDPGWKSCGVSLLKDGKIIFTKNYIPESYGTPRDFIEHGLWEDLDSLEIDNIDELFIERYVAYAGVTSSASEEILMNIGALCFWFGITFDCRITLLRAIDWKTRLCKYLVRNKGFDNPYPSFDKKFSVLAARAISGMEEIKSNHEADAICLSYMKEVEIYEAQRNK